MGTAGHGKRPLARLLAGATARTSSSCRGARRQGLRAAVEQAQALRAAGRATVVFVDEVHRFNKAQQDAFLPHVESGLFTFIGATTENPSFEVNSALLSRAGVQVLEPLGAADLCAARPRRSSARTRHDRRRGARASVEFAVGDGRRLLNAVESVVAANTGAKAITPERLQAALGSLLRRGDKGGEVYYDTISALHKSVRGSDPDATLYWLARLLDAGMDPRYAARRLVRMASEDIGLADPRARASP